MVLFVEEIGSKTKNNVARPRTMNLCLCILSVDEETEQRRQTRRAGWIKIQKKHSFKRLDNVPSLQKVRQEFYKVHKESETLGFDENRCLLSKNYIKRHDKSTYEHDSNSLPSLELTLLTTKSSNIDELPMYDYFRY